MTTALGQGWNVLVSAVATSYQLLKMALWRMLLGGNFTSLFSWSLPHFYFSLLASSFFFVTEWLLFSCRSSSNNLIGSLFFLLPCLALGCQQVCHDFAHDLLLAECGQWAGLLMDCFFGLFLREGSYSIFSALLHMFDGHMQNRWGKWRCRVSFMLMFKFIKQHFLILHFDDGCTLKKQLFPLFSYSHWKNVVSFVFSHLSWLIIYPNNTKYAGLLLMKPGEQL